MKKYLENLEAELKKLKISNEDIAEILADHKEMIEAAYEDGVSDEDLLEKFGNPDQVAKELYGDSFNDGKNFESKPLIQEGDLKGYALIKAFPVLDGVNQVSISLVSEDVKYFPHDSSSLEVYAKHLKDEEDYNINYVDGQFTLEKRKMKKFRIGLSMGKSVKFIVKVPFEQFYDSFKVNLVSADLEFMDINAKRFEIKTTSGDVEGQTLETENEVKLTSVSGDIELENVKAKNMEISLVSGDLEMKNVVLSEDIKVNTVSGDVEVEHFKAINVDFRTVSGDFEGLEAYVDSVSFKSVSGDFEIANKIKEHEIDVKYNKSLSGKVTIK